jgi:hypothetical protein
VWNPIGDTPVQLGPSATIKYSDGTVLTTRVRGQLDVQSYPVMLNNADIQAFGNSSTTARLAERPAGYAVGMHRFPFRFAPSYRVPALLFGVVPSTTWVEVDDAEVRARFGPWTLRTPRANVVSAQETGGFGFLKTAGPAHLSLSDRGVTFATNGDRAVCMLFREPVRAIDPTGRIRHPGATFTVADPGGLLAALEESRPSA